MSWTQAELDALKRAYASGTLRVSYDGKTVDYAAGQIDHPRAFSPPPPPILL